MGLLSNIFMLFYCTALLSFKKHYTKSECDAAIEFAIDAAVDASYDDAYEAGFKAANDARFDHEYEYGYQYYEEDYPSNSCGRDSDCLEDSNPKCVSGLCQKLSGGVLFMGGYVSSSISASVAKMGSCAGNVVDLPIILYDSAASVLDGLVFHCGGNTPAGITDKCYIRSSSGQWTEGPRLNNAVYGLTLNKVGSTLVAIGGYGKYSALSNSVEILTPGSNGWVVQVYTISPARYDHCAVTVSSTQIFLAGGDINPNTNPSSNTEMLNVNTGSITRYANLPLGLYDHSCVLHQGRILLAGGHNPAGYSKQVFTLDYSNPGNQWISTGSLVSIRREFSMEIIQGVPTAFGGLGAETSMEKYEGGVWKSQAFTAPRSSHSSVVIC